MSRDKIDEAKLRVADGANSNANQELCAHSRHS